MDPLKPLKMYFLLKMGMFHCYVSLPEGTYLEDRSRYKPRFPKTTPGTPRPSIYKCLFQLDDDSKSLKKKIVGNHHFHPSLNGWPWGSRRSTSPENEPSCHLKSQPMVGSDD